MLLWYYLDVVLLSDDGYARLMVVNQMTNTYTINRIQGMIGGSSGGVFKLIQFIIIGDLSSLFYMFTIYLLAIIQFPCFNCVSKSVVSV